MDVFVFVLFQLIGFAFCTDCPDGWLAFEGSCYLLEFDSVHFTEAEEYCKQHGANLVHVETNEENMFLKGFIQSYLKEADYWIGMTDEIIEGVWKWYGSNTPIEFSDWGPTEPQDANMAEDCAVFHHSLKYQWADVGCATNRKALCEKRIDDQTSIVG
ncbi:perlucin-like protein [Mercenaria mercenaria]|uniref:perlucin-like protein n=1 Tax=Mercenaria mercenaria TaxID=6596 RepID=UPI001E1D8550|nr:perlucin-like protein [Mercenaria mercenaria]